MTAKNVLSRLIHAAAITFCLMLLLQMAFAQRRQEDTQLRGQIERQESHIDNTDKNVQAILSRVDTDEGYAKGAAAMIIFLQSLNLLKGFAQRKSQSA